MPSLFKRIRTMKDHEAPNVNEPVSNKTVLIAEDNYLSYFLLSTIVKKYGLNVVWAQNGREAVKLFRENPDIELVFMDINMPEMDGLEATKKIKELRKSVPVIIQTSLTECRKTSFNAGCDDFISKPYDLKLIKNIISKHLGGCFYKAEPCSC